MKKMWKIVVFCFVLTLTAGCYNDEGDGGVRYFKSEWIAEFFREVTSGSYPDIHAVSWWNENFDETYLRIDSSQETLEAYRLLVENGDFSTNCQFSSGKLIPDGSRLYHSAFPDFGGTEDIVTSQAIKTFEDLAGERIAWAYFSNNWGNELVFPASAVSTIHNYGRTPFIRIMFRSEFEEDRADPNLDLRDIVNGVYDDDIKDWAEGAINSGINLLAEFGTEVNGKWFSWNGTYYGGGTTNGYGDPAYPDGPEIFRDAYRHIIDLCNAEGADKITWFYHFDDSDDPDEWWNSPEYYYPGDGYIDWIGVSTYGSFSPDEEYVAPQELIKKAYGKLLNVSKNKPYAILEFGVTEF